MSAKAGRPKSADPKIVDLKVRVTMGTYEKICDYALRHKISIAAAVRKGIEKLYEDEEQK